MVMLQRFCYKEYMLHIFIYRLDNILLGAKADLHGLQEGDREDVHWMADGLSDGSGVQASDRDQ